MIDLSLPPKRLKRKIVIARRYSKGKYAIRRRDRGRVRGRW